MEDAERDQVSRLTEIMTEMRMRQQTTEELIQTLVSSIPPRPELSPLSEEASQEHGPSLHPAETLRAATAEGEATAKTSTESTKTPSATSSKTKPIDCPRIGRKSYIGEYVALVVLWLHSLPEHFAPNNETQKKTVSVVIAEALHDRPEYQSAWLQIVNDAANATMTIHDGLMLLKNEVIVEEKAIAKSEFDKRNKLAEETFSEYRVALNILAQVAFPSYSSEERADRVLDRFLSGIGEIGPAVRSQAPANQDEAIRICLAVSAERQKSNVLMFNQTKPKSFTGFCGRCGKRGHRTVECPANNAQPNVLRPRMNPITDGNRPEYQFRRQPMMTRPPPPSRGNTRTRFNPENRICYRCRSRGHIASNCTLNRVAFVQETGFNVTENQEPSNSQ